MNEKPYFYDIFQFGKAHALPFKHAKTHFKALLDLIYFDIWDHAPIIFNSGCKYYIHFLDDFTWITWIYPLKFKYEAKNVFIQFKSLVEDIFETKIKTFQSDSRREYRSFVPLLNLFGILFQHPCPRMHELNGRVEKKHQHSIDKKLI